MCRVEIIDLGSLRQRPDEVTYETRMPHRKAQASPPPTLLIINIQHGIRDRVIAAVSTNYSVEAKVRSVGNMGYATTVTSDTTSTFNIQDISGRLGPAEDVHLLLPSNLRGE